VETEGWLLTVGGTPKQMLAHDPEFTYSRLLQAARMAKRMGAQIMGLGAFTKVVGDAGVTVAKKANIPITTGNSYSASGALWAAADAVRRMGLIKIKRPADQCENHGSGRDRGHWVGLLPVAGQGIPRSLSGGRNTAKLLAMKESIHKEDPDVKLTVTTLPDKYLADMDVIVTATSGAGKKVLDITKVKPGCVITDVARPLDLSSGRCGQAPGRTGDRIRRNRIAGQSGNEKHRPA
jgi:predicted amino acid dehydrogenase